MSTSEIFNPFIICGLLAVIGAMGVVGAFAVKEYTILDADEQTSKFNREPNSKSRTAFLTLFSLPPFVCGAMWGLVYVGMFQEIINEPTSYAVAMFIGIVANSIVVKSNDMSIQNLIKTIRSNL